MKLSHLALIMTAALMGLTIWLATGEHSRSADELKEKELFRNRETAGPAGIAAQNEMLRKEQQILAMQSAGAPLKPGLPPPLEPPPITQPVKSTLPPVDAAAQLTPLQHKVLSMPALAKVIEYNKEYGFVLIDAGFKKKVTPGSVFLLRRGGGIVARIKVSTVEEDTSVGDLDSKSIPPGVTVQLGDEAIQDLPPGA